jgi:hypothetical protein
VHEVHLVANATQGARERMAGAAGTDDGDPQESSIPVPAPWGAVRC